MNTEHFIKTVQTFGSFQSKWETDFPEELLKWSETDEGAGILKAEKELDNQLDMLTPPVCTEMFNKIQSAIIQENMQRQFLFFWKISPWISFVCMLGGFYFGWQQNYLDDINAQNYVTSMFDEIYYELFL